MRCTRGSLTGAGDDERGTTVVGLRAGYQRRGAPAPAYRRVAGGAGGPDPAGDACVPARRGHRALLIDRGARVAPSDDSGAGGGADPGPGAGGGALAGDGDRAGRHAGHRGRAAARGTPAAPAARLRGVPAWAFGALAGLLAAVWSALRRPRSAR